MFITVGLALIALGVLSVRGAALYAMAPAASPAIKDFIGGSVFTLTIEIGAAIGVILIADTVLQGLWRATTVTGDLLSLVIVAGAIAGWWGLGRLQAVAAAKAAAGDATVLTMPESRPTPSATPANGRRTKKRAA